MKKYYVYILKCSDDFLYTGITNNIERRFEEHKEGLNKNWIIYKCHFERSREAVESKS